MVLTAFANDTRWPGGLLRLCVVAALASCANQDAGAQSVGSASPRPAEAEIRAAAKAYVDALGRGDGRSCAALWTPDGDIVDEFGKVLDGAKVAAAIKPTPSGTTAAVIRFEETSIRFLTEDVAIEDGMVEVGPAGSTGAAKGRFSATWVRHDGQWKLAALRESRAAEPSGAASLRELDWMVGEWSAERKPPAADAPLAPAVTHPVVELSVRWNESRTFLLRDMRLTPQQGGAGADLVISQRIGWDPLTRRIRSWAFGSDGSHAEATWLRDDDGSWVAHTTSVRPDGNQTTSINVYAYDGQDRMLWRSLPTHVGAEHATPVSMTLVRKPGGARK